MADLIKKFAQHRFGPGGLKCRCCGGDPHGKHKREMLRHLKHSAHQVIAREISEDIRDLDEDFDWNR